MKKVIFLTISISVLSFCASIKEYQATYREELEKADEERFGSSKSKSESLGLASQEEAQYKIVMVKHPDLNFPPTDWNSVVIYEGFMPLDDKFFTIAKIGTVEFGGISDDEELRRELKLKAAEIGGHALIMVDAKSESKEFGGGITAMSFPQYFWWFHPREGLKQEYTGTQYYFLELPKQTITNYSRIYAVIKFERKTELELRSLWKKNLRSGMEESFRKAGGVSWDKAKESMGALLDALCEDYPLATPKGIYRIWLEEIKKGTAEEMKKESTIDDLGKHLGERIKHQFAHALKLSHEEEVDRIFKIFEQTYKEEYPLAGKDEIATLLSKTDENGEFLYTFEEAMKISHQRKK